MKDHSTVTFKSSLLILLLLGLFLPFSSNAQEVGLVDQVVAVVGKHIILESDLENQYLQLRMQGEIVGTKASNKCRILEDILFQKLLLMHNVLGM